MMRNNIEKLLEILKQDERLLLNGDIKENYLVQLILQNDEELLKNLIEIDDIKEEFFIETSIGYTFLQDKFLEFLSGKAMHLNSYTKYKNKVGLLNNEKLIKVSNDVVIGFPYKDSILEGGQSKEEISGDKKEVFYNQIIDKREIDRLLEPKAFTNVKRYVDGDIETDVEWNKNENLIIKGNNLISLKSLEEVYKDSVKLIYIDVPYNTENDSFEYNDKFTRATWLTFMMNRLKAAQHYLKDDGFLCVQISDKNVHYLKVLLDEVIGEDKFINNVVVKMSEVSGPKMAHVKKRIPKIKEHLLIYKNPNGILNPVKVERDEWDTEYSILLKNFTKDDKTIIDSIIQRSESGTDSTEEDVQTIDEILSNVEIGNAFTEMRELELSDEEKKAWLHDNSYRICRSVASPSVKTLADEKRRNNDKLLFCVISSRDKIPYIVKSNYSEESTSPRVQMIFAEDMLTTYLGDIWSDINTTGLEAEGGVQLKNGKKPEKLMERIIGMTTNEDDLVMDFFLGSGTTAAVAHKMKRRYIGIEQLDYGENDSVVRLNNIINDNQEERSTELSWDSGGSFIYAELMKYNQLFVDQILEASNTEELNSIFELIKEKGFLNYRVNLEEANTNDEDFKNLSLENQKSILIEFLDQNQLYVNYRDIEDEMFEINESDRKFMDSFYEGGQ